MSRYRIFIVAALAAVLSVSGVAFYGARTADAAFPQPAWPDTDQADNQRCASNSGPQGAQADVLEGLTGPGAMVAGNYISFICNYRFSRGNGSAGVAITVEYCGGQTQSLRRQSGNYTTAAGEYTIREQRWVLHQGALLVIVLYTDGTNFNTQEMVARAQNLADTNRPQGAVPCPGGGTTQPGGGTPSTPGAGGDWSITLATDDAQLIAGNDFTLTATANKTTAGTDFFIYIVNQTDDDIVFCRNVRICTHKDFKNEPGVRIYRAFVADGAGGNVQAASNTIAITWSEWSGSVDLIVEDADIDSGDVAKFTAFANPTVNGSIYALKIDRQDGGYEAGFCLESPCQGTDVYESAGVYNYVAKVVKHDKTGQRGISPAVKVTWKATEEWDGKVGIRSANGIEIVALGVPVVVEAFATPDLMGTDYVLTIVEEAPGGGGVSSTCDAVLQEVCKLTVVSNENTSRFFRAIVHRRDGAGGAKASSEFLLTVTWSPDGAKKACDDGWEVKEVVGTAHMLVGGTLKQPLKVGQWVCPGDTVETQQNSTVKGDYWERGMFNANLGRKAEINLRERTNVTIGFFESGTTWSVLDLATGRGEFFVDGIRKSDFRIKSPTAVVSVRGTKFTVTIDPANGSTHVAVYEGEVFVEPDNPSLNDITLRPGEQVTIGASTASPVTKVYGTLQHKRRLPAVIREGLN